MRIQLPHVLALVGALGLAIVTWTAGEPPESPNALREEQSTDASANSPAPARPDALPMEPRTGMPHTGAAGTVGSLAGPVADAAIAVRHVPSGRTTSNDCDAQGRFRIALEAGIYTAWAEAPAWGRGDPHTWRILDGAVLDAGALTLAPAGHLEGWAAAADGPVVNARIRITPQGVPHAARVVTTDAAGRFETALRTGRHIVTASAGMRKAGPHTIDVRTRETTSIRLRLAAPARLDVDVRNDAGDPVEGARVLLLRDGRRTGTTRTDETGRASFAALATGPYDLIAESADGTHGVRTTVFASGAIRQVIALSPARQLRARLLDPNHQPLAGLRVELQMGAGKGERSAVSDAEGRVAVHVPGAGIYGIRIRSMDYRGTVDVDDAGSERTIRIDAGAAQLVGVVRNEAGRAVADALLVFAASPGVRRRTRTDGEGRFAIRRLVPGRGHLIVRAGDQAARRGIDLGRGETELDVFTTQGAQLRGRIDIEGSPAPPEALQLEDMETGEQFAPTAAEDGYVLRGIPAGEYTLRLGLGWERRYAFEAVRVSLTASELRALDVTLTRR